MNESIKLTTPKQDGFRMPAEFEPHDGCIMIWPVRPGSFPYGAVPAQAACLKIYAAIAKSELLYVLANREDVAEAQEAIDTLPMEIADNIIVMELPTDDAWARDTAPTFVRNDSGEVRGISWKFNAWGGDYDGLYEDYEQDDAVADTFCEKLEIPCYDARPFVLEGGSIHVDGQGTALVTEACLLSPGRNPSLSKAEIEDRLREYLNVEKIIWLPHGIYNDETNEHVDNVCAFTAPGHVVLAMTDDPDDPQYMYSHAALNIFARETDARGRKITVHPLPIPSKPICITQRDLDGYTFAPGEDNREVGERLAASYVNFYIANNAIIMPAFDDANDAIAALILQGCFPDREIVRIPARDLLVGGGNIHCLTQQIVTTQMLKYRGIRRCVT